MSFNIKEIRIGIIGLGYVGLPLAVEFGKKYPTVGFDIKAERIAELSRGKDSTLECSSQEIAQAGHLRFTSNALRTLSRAISTSLRSRHADRRQQSAAANAT